MYIKKILVFVLYRIKLVILVKELVKKRCFKKIFVERILEDYDTLVENMVMWIRDIKNRILYEEREEKNDLFRRLEV